MEKFEGQPNPVVAIELDLVKKNDLPPITTAKGERVNSKFRFHCRIRPPGRQGLSESLDSGFPRFPVRPRRRSARIRLRDRRAPLEYILGRHRHSRPRTRRHPGAAFEHESDIQRTARPADPSPKPSPNPD